MLFRCYRCDPPKGTEFEANEPICPSCKAGPPAVLQLVSVHYLFQADDGRITGQHGKKWHIACAPGKPMPAGISATGETQVVTCPRCKASEPFSRHHKAFLDNATFGPGVLVNDGGCC